ncbi:MAG: resolvase, partial [Pedobacter sp.]
MKIGYARVSTFDQNLNLQLDALKHARCEEIFEEKISGASKERPQLIKLFSRLR